MNSALESLLPKALPLSAHEYPVQSQRGPIEEGLHLHFMDVVPPGEKYCIEFGARDGTTAHTRHLVESHGFSALYIEGDPAAAARLKENYAQAPQVTAIESFVTAENIESLFERAQVPARPYLLTIDVDGIDYYLWRAIEKYRPVFVAIEYNASYPPDSDFVIDYAPTFQWRNDDYFGAAIKPFVDLAKSKGYELIHVTSGGDNLFFVDQEFYPRFGIADNSPETMYQLPQYGRNGRARNGKGHPISAKTSSRLERLLSRLRYRLLSLARRVIKKRMKRTYAANRAARLT